jgi:hypothetical protein
MPHRNIHAPLEALLAQEAHGYCGEPFGDFYQPPKPFVLSLSNHYHFE